MSGSAPGSGHNLLMETPCSGLQFDMHTSWLDFAVHLNQTKRNSVSKGERYMERKCTGSKF